MATGTIIPSPVFTGLDANGDPVSGGKLYTYVAGTTTPQTTYSDVGLTSANANPIVLDSSGRATVYVPPGSSFKYVLKTSADVTLWTADNIGAVPKSTATVDITVTAGEAITALDAAYISQGDGGKTAGRAYKTDADNDYASTTAVVVGLAPSAIASGETGSLRISGALGGYTGLTGGAKQYASATAGELTESAPSNAKVVGQASSTTTVAITAAVSTIDASQIVSGTLAVARGGTGIASYSTNDFLRASGSTTLAATAANAVFPYISPLTTRGDVLVGTSGVVSGTRLALGAANTYLKSDGTDAAWASVSTVANVLSKTADYTIADGDGKDVIVKADGSSNAITITLLAASTAGSGATVTVMKTDASADPVNRITIDGNGSETINGSLTQTIWRMNQSLRVVCDGSNWIIVNSTQANAFYPVTLAKIQNTTTETAVFTWNMAANTFQEGDSLHVLAQARGKQNTGGAETLYWDALFDSSADGGSAVEFDVVDTSINTSSTNGQGSLALRMARGGSDTNESVFVYYNSVDDPWSSNAQWTKGTNNVSNSSVEFDKDNVVSLKADFSVASANMYIVPWSCQVIHSFGSSGNLDV